MVCASRIKGEKKAVWIDQGVFSLIIVLVAFIFVIAEVRRSCRDLHAPADIASRKTAVCERQRHNLGQHRARLFLQIRGIQNQDERPMGLGVIDHTDQHSGILVLVKRRRRDEHCLTWEAVFLFHEREKRRGTKMD